MTDRGAPPPLPPQLPPPRPLPARSARLDARLRMRRDTHHRNISPAECGISLLGPVSSVVVRRVRARGPTRARAVGYRGFDALRRRGMTDACESQVFLLTSERKSPFDATRLIANRRFFAQQHREQEPGSVRANMPGRRSASAVVAQPSDRDPVLPPPPPVCLRSLSPSFLFHRVGPAHQRDPPPPF